jgi:hypothetical protein
MCYGFSHENPCVSRKADAPRNGVTQPEITFSG